MRSFLPCILLIAGAGLLPASVVETISIDLSVLHPGSTLSGTFTLPDAPMIGDTAPVTLSFSDPSDYTPTSLITTITIGSGTSLPDTVTFSDLIFTNPSGNSFTTNVDLMVAGMAQCGSFPCTATGRIEDGSPAAFTTTYTIAPAGIPEPAYGPLLSVMLGAFVIGRRVTRRRALDSRVPGVTAFWRLPSPGPCRTFSDRP